VSRWPEVALGAVLTERRETPDPLAVELGTIPVVAKIAFDSGLLEFREGSGSKTGMILIRPGDLVVSGINAHKGAIALYGQECSGPVAATIHYAAYQAKHDRADPRFLWWLLRSPAFRDALDRSVPGGVKTELKAKRLLPIPVPLPPLEEQRRVVRKIEQLAARVSRVHGLGYEATEETRALAAAVVREAFATEGRRLAGSRLGDFVVDAIYGTSEKCESEPIGIPVLRMGNIRDGRVDTRELKFLRALPGLPSRLLLRVGDILVNRTNSAELVGKCAVFDLGGEWSFASYLIRLRLDTTRADPQFVASFINGPAGREYMFRERKQMTGQANINARKLLALPISLPPLAEQERLGQLVSRMSDRLGALARKQERARTAVGRLVPAALSAWME